MGGSNTPTSYTYKSAVAMGLCSGPIGGIGKFWEGKNRFLSLTDPNATTSLTLLTGTTPQMPWGYLSANHAPEAMAYSGLAYVASTSASLGSSATLNTYTFEVAGLGMSMVAVSPEYSYQVTEWDGQTDTNGDPVYTTITVSVPAVYGMSSSVGPMVKDENPNVVILDLLNRAGFNSSRIGDTSQYSKYCVAANLLVSPAYTEQKAAKDMLIDLTSATNSEFVWSQGQLTLVPYADASFTGNGITFTPNMTPIYDLNDDDFIVSSAGAPGDLAPSITGQTSGVSTSSAIDDPVQCTRSTTADAFNHIQVEYSDRNQDYNAVVAEAKDQADIERNGLRTKDPITMHFICDRSIAQAVAQIILQQTLYVRNTYEFKLSWNYCLLEPMDLISINDALMGLNQSPVRVKKISEDVDGLLSFTVEECPIGVYAHALHAHQNPLGYLPNYQVDPGSVNAPVIFEPPAALTAGSGLEVWIAVSGGVNWGSADVWVSTDDVSYHQIAKTTGSARQGLITSSLPAIADPDTSSTLAVNLSVSRGQLLSGTRADADALNTLCYVDGELIAYQTATLTAANKYSLSYLRRGAYGTTIAAHPVNSQFARLDQSIVKYAFDPSLIGSQIWFKLASSNTYGAAHQDLSIAPAYAYTITGIGITEPPANVAGLTAAVTRGQMLLSWDAVADVLKYAYEIQIGTAWGAPGNTTIVSKYSGTSYQWTPTSSGTINLMIKAINANGYYSASATSLAYMISPPGPVASLSQGSIDNIVQLSWTTGTIGTFPLDHYEIWKGATFAGAVMLGQKYSTFDLIQETLAGTFKYWVRAVDVAGLASVESGVYAVVNAPPDYVLISEQNVDFATATLTNATLESGQLVLPIDLATNWQTHFTGNSWSTPQDQVTAGYALYGQPGTSSATVEKIIDYGALIPSSMITLGVTRVTMAGTIAVTPEILTSPDNSTWTSLGNAYQVAASTFRYVKYRLVVTTIDGGIATIQQINTKLDVKQKTTVNNTLSITDTTSDGTAFTFSSLGISPVDVVGITATAPWTNTSADPITVLVNFVGVSNPTSFKLLAWNKSGTRVAVSGVTATIRYI